MKAFRNQIALSVVLSLAFGGFIAFSHYRSVATHGSVDLLQASAFLLLPCLAVAIVFPIAAICCFVRRLRRKAIFVLVSSGMLVSACFGGIRLGNALRRQGFAKLAQRSAPLINAIKNYETKYGRPPADLQAITPEFLPEIPGTGMAAYPRYTYRVAKAAYDGNPWHLEVFTPSGILNFDKFIYYPLQNYPRHWCGQPLKPIGDWAYLHE